MSCLKARKTRDALLILGALFCLVAYLFQPVVYIGMALWLAGLAVHVLYCKCPHCGSHIGRNYGDFCQYCGKKLE